MGLGKLGRSGLSKIIEYQFQRGHVVPQIFFFQSFKIFILPRGHARPRFGDLIRQDRILYALLDAAVLPFAGQLLTHLNGLQALIDPLPRITFFQMRFQRPLNRQLQVNGFLDPFASDLRQPHFERLSLL